MVMTAPMKVYNTSLPLPALQGLDRCLNALSSNLYRSVVSRLFWLIARLFRLLSLLFRLASQLYFKYEILHISITCVDDNNYYIYIYLVTTSLIPSAECFLL